MCIKDNMKIYNILSVALLILVMPLVALAQLTVPQGGTGQTSFTGGYIPYGGSSTLRLDREAAFSYSASLNRLTVDNASTTGITATQICLSGDTCRTTWPTISGSIATSGALANTEIVYATAANTVDSESAFTYDAAGDKVTVVNASTTRLAVSTIFDLFGNVWDAITDLRDYVWSTFTGGTGIAFTSGDISFDCSEVEGTGIDCVGEAVTLDATGDWTGTIDGNNFAGGAIGAGQLLYGSGAGTLSELTLGASSTILTNNGTVPLWAAGTSLCVAITGSADLCDGSDAGGGGSSNWTDNGTYLTPLTSTDGILLTGSSSFAYVDLASTTIRGTTRLASQTASRALFVNSSNNLVTSAASADLLATLTNETGTGVAVFNTTPTFATSALSPIWQSTAADTADAGVLRLGNAEIIGWEASPAGTDVTLTVNSSEVLTLAGGGFTATGGTATFGTLAGALDAGAATSFEIPNGTAPTVDVAGEIALDTTDFQLIVGTSTTATVVPTRDVPIWSTTIASTSIDFINGGLVPVPTRLDGYKITRIQCHVTGGTSKVIAVEDASANSSEDITCATTNTTDDGSITNADYTASELSYIDFGATSGAVNYVTISVFGNWIRE